MQVAVVQSRQHSMAGSVHHRGAGGPRVCLNITVWATCSYPVIHDKYRTGVIYQAGAGHRKYDSAADKR